MAMTEMTKLTMMANQIAQFFRSYPHDDAVAGIAHHIEAFWTPKMRQALKDGLYGAPDLDPLAVKAMLSELQGQDPVKNPTAGPDQVGELGAVDAG